MKYGMISIDSIRIGERARKDYGNYSDIVETAKGAAGQIQSLAVKETDDLEFPYELIAGGRRLKAFKEAGLVDILVRIYDKSLTSQEQLEIELIENMARMDMTWAEKVAQVKKIHDLRVQLHGEKTSSSDTKGWSQAMTAELLGKSVASVSRDLELSKAIQEIPELAQAKDKKEATKMKDRLEERQILAELSKRAGDKIAASSVEVLQQRMCDAYHVGDSFEFMSTLPDGTFDLVECDPDYGINFGAFKKKTAIFDQSGDQISADDYHEVEKADYPAFMEKLIKECTRLLKPDGWLLMWHSPDWAGVIADELENHEYTVPAPLVWYKTAGGRVFNPDTYLSRAYECMFYARKGKAALVQRGKMDVEVCARANPVTRIHPAEKPTVLMELILARFITTGAKCLVPFLGSGNTIIACTHLGADVVGCDLSQANKDKFVVEVMTAHDIKLTPRFMPKATNPIPPKSEDQILTELGFMEEGGDPSQPDELDLLDDGEAYDCDEDGCELCCERDSEEDCEEFDTEFFD
jgi:ParB/RepB/Spo0J family partition protein